MEEFCADFVAVNPYHFTLNMPLNHIYMLPSVVDHSIYSASVIELLMVYIYFSGTETKTGYSLSETI